MYARIVDGRKIASVTDDGKLKVLVHGRDGDDLVPVDAGIAEGWLEGTTYSKLRGQHKFNHYAEIL